MYIRMLTVRLLTFAVPCLAGCGGSVDDTPSDTEPGVISGSASEALHGHRDRDRRPASEHRFCGWLHEFSDPALTALGYDTFARHARDFDAVHPKWWRVDSETTFANHPAGRDAPFAAFHDPRVLANTTPGGRRTKLIPLVAATTTPDNLRVHTMINDADLRREHISTLVELAVTTGYDGVDVDYEHFSRGITEGQTRATERDAFSAFISELATGMHAEDKVVTVDVPVEAGDSQPVFDYDALSETADQLHLMAYDFHYEGGEHPGPVSPLGWVEEAVAYATAVGGGERNGKFILGLPNYGLYGPEQPPDNFETSACEPSSECLSMFTQPYATTTDHMTHCTVADKYYDAGRAPNEYLPDGDHLFFDDLRSLEEKVRVAAAAGLGGITYWSIGGEPSVPGRRTFFQMVRSYFPRHR